MRKVLIVSDHLMMAGAERLIFELVRFCQQNQLKVVVLIVNNYNLEYYDPIFKKMGVAVIRTTLQGVRKLRNPMNFVRALYWITILKYFASRRYRSIQVIGLYNVPKVIGTISHPKRFFWNVTNAIQFENERFPFPEHIFQNENDTIIHINTYQADELVAQYTDERIKCKMRFFKLFTAD